MSPTSIAKARLRLEAASVRVAAIEVETAAEIAVAAAVGRVAAVVVVDAGGVVVAAADGTAVADTAADDTRGQTFGSHLKWAGVHALTYQHLGAATLVAALFLLLSTWGELPRKPALKRGGAT